MSGTEIAFATADKNGHKDGISLIETPTLPSVRTAEGLKEWMVPFHAQSEIEGGRGETHGANTEIVKPFQKQSEIEARRGETAGGNSEMEAGNGRGAANGDSD
eukprot:1851262-Rhodomonas_salina.2